MWFDKFVASITFSVNLPIPSIYDEKKGVIVTYVMKRNLFGQPKCICYPKVIEHSRTDNPTGPGSHWSKFHTKNTEIYMKYVLPWLQGDLYALQNYFLDNNCECPQLLKDDIFHYKYIVPNRQPG